MCGWKEGQAVSQMMEAPPCLLEKFAHDVTGENSRNRHSNGARKGQPSPTGCSGWMDESLILIDERFTMNFASSLTSF